MSLRLVLRQLRLNPAFAVTAVGILGLGIGANTALFSVIQAVLLSPLPYPEPERVVALGTRWSGRPNSFGQVSGPDFADWRDRSTSFEALAAYAGGEGNAVAAGSAHYAEIRSVSRGFDRALGIAPSQGRWFLPEEERQGGPAAVVVSHSFAQRVFAGEALGKPIKISDKAATIVGVMPPGFRFPDRTDLWTPSGTDFEKQHRTGHNWQVVGRLKPSVSVEQASAELLGISEQIAREYPAENKQKRAGLIPLKDRLVRDFRLVLWTLFGAVALVLLIACANIANLLLAKANARRRELAVRAALGASPRQIVSQLLAESAVLGVFGCIAGVAIGTLLLRVLTGIAPVALPRAEEIRMNPIVFLFAAGLSLLATLLFGLLPAWRASRADVQESLRMAGARGTTAGKLPQALVVSEVALATMLAIGAGLLVRSFAGLLQAELGYSVDQVLVAEARTMFAENEQGAVRNVRWYEDTISEIRGLPGVKNASGIFGVPGTTLRSNGSYLTGGGELDIKRFDQAKSALFTVVTPNYFGTVSLPMLEGRDFNGRDLFDAPFVAVVNRAFVREAFPNGIAIGQQIACGLDSLKWMTIVGVVEDSRTLGPASQHQPEIYMPAAQHPRPAQHMSLVVRTTSDPQKLQSPIRAIVQRRDPEAPVKFTTLETVLAGNIAVPRFRTVLLGSMAFLAVLLAMAGVYGVTSYAVGLRTSEFGVRMAVGASPGEIIRMVLSQGGMLAGLGIAIGLGGALAASEVLKSMVFGVTARDPLTYTVVALAVVLTALAANLVPALRAGRVDPVTALRNE
jgi:putative ABC transport system permease protein